MASARDLRRCALQALYQLDAGAEPGDSVRRSLDDSPGSAETHQRGYDLALKAWAHRHEADAEVAALAPQWPTHRQAAVDRSLLRLAWYEMIHGGTPPKVVINEAVELAREFSTDKSPLFINGVLDKIYKTRRDAPDEAARTREPAKSRQPSAISRQGGDQRSAISDQAEP